MLKFKNISNIFFIGIGGIGMSALARYFKLLNFNVIGYDANETDLTRQLEKENIKIYYQYSLAEIKELNRTNTVVIYTPAVNKHNKILRYFLKNNFRVYKRAEILADIFNNSKNSIAIAGTHGKTTITALISHILNISGYKPLSFIGGITINYNTNLIYNDNPYFIVTEADEYDNSFLLLNPSNAIISSIEEDHFDTFSSHKKLTNAFVKFSGKVNSNGYLVVHDSISNIFNHKNIYTYSLNSDKNYISNIRINKNKSYFNINTTLGSINNVKSQLHGNHNYENILAVTLMLQLLNIDNKTIKEGIETFKGVKRRFEIVHKTKNIIIIDDYAHHPTAITKVAETARKLYKNKKLTAIFQPHLYSRTLHLYEDFANALSLFDEVILFDIYPAREKPIKNVNSSLIYNKIKTKNKILSDFDNIASDITKRKHDVIIIMGAGNINNIIHTLKKIYND